MYEDHKRLLELIFDAARLSIDDSESKWEYLEDPKNKKDLEYSYSLISKILKEANLEGKILQIFNPILEIKLDYVSAINSVYQNSLSLYDIFHSTNSIAHWHNLVLSMSSIKTNAIKILENYFFEINIEIIEKENPKLNNFINEYRVAQELFSEGQYEKAIEQARNTFQEDLEGNFDGSIKMFENSNEGSIEFYFNEIIKNISEMRHKYLKTTDKPHNNKMRAIAKLSIEQLINIRNYLEINKS